MSMVSETGPPAPEPGPPPSVEELRGVTAFEDLSDDDLLWLASRMETKDLPTGAVLIREGDPADQMIVVLRGAYTFTFKDGLTVTRRAPEVTGALPFSRSKTFPGTAQVIEDARVATLRSSFFPELTNHLPVLQTRLVHLLSDRIRTQATVSYQREKLMALGKLSAGLAHELNNPAAAAARAADMLRKTIATARTAVLELDHSELPAESRVFLAELECDWEQRAGPAAVVDTLERSDREEEFIVWLERHKIQNAYDLAGPLVDLGCTRELLDLVAEHVPQQYLEPVFTRLTASFTVTRLADEITSATSRISELVQAVKEYSYRDQTPLQQVDIHAGIETTLIMLKHRLKNGIEISRQYDRSLPSVYARGSDLNQVWTNLITNAADAMNGTGKLIIKTCSDRRCARVEVIDSGPGIAEDAKPHIFEPFFTTKGVGEGTGLGLDTSYRIVSALGGDMFFESEPGRTMFVVRLPFSGIAPPPQDI